MLNGLCGKGNFYRRCKTALKMINLRIELIMKKRKAMQMFLKTDISDLLKNNLDYNAYGRAEGLYLELHLSSCYSYIQECCKLVSDHLKSIHKERECPEECRVAVACIVYAASRFSDLVELRDIRTLLMDKYGELDGFDTYVSKELVEKLKWNPPTAELKLEVMKEIAKEFAVEWEAQDEFNCQEPQLLQLQLQLQGEEEEEESIEDRGEWKPTPSEEIRVSRTHTLNVNHVHPNMPDCDKLATRIQDLRTK